MIVYVDSNSGIGVNCEMTTLVLDANPNEVEQSMNALAAVIKFAIVVQAKIIHVLEELESCYTAQVTLSIATSSSSFVRTRVGS